MIYPSSAVPANSDHPNDHSTGDYSLTVQFPKFNFEFLRASGTVVGIRFVIDLVINITFFGKPTAALIPNGVEEENRSLGFHRTFDSLCGDGMDSSRYIPTNPALQVIIDSDDKECNGIRTDSVQSSWTSSKGRKDVDTVKRRTYGIEYYIHEMETYIKRVKDIGARWRRVRRHAVAGYRISTIARSNTLTTLVKVPISRARTLLVLSPTRMRSHI
ncbi:hypothetical protein CPC08DRAFT_725400 [Agrocybe pediades]|nr:hypothetical protein CPC08DRAFT_725400 [Agrocybe pediades]